MSRAVPKGECHAGAAVLLVNNAGYGRHRRFLEWDLDDMERMLQVNFLGTLYWTKALLPRMVKPRRGVARPHGVVGRAIRTDFFGPEELARMPPVAKRGMIEPEPVIEAMMRALRRGAREVTVPRGIAAAYVVRAIAPGFMRRSTKRVTLDAMARARRP